MSGVGVKTMKEVICREDREDVHNVVAAQICSTSFLNVCGNVGVDHDAAAMFETRSYFLT